ncbi:MAG: hypothetical protein KDA92_13280 [Planctomycetales bacterium]|nr:hypothetical protein [Planctomycetales bacterium]MCA9167692.1 hypothetical protein [Planctomycetales bacterium]
MSGVVMTVRLPRPLNGVRVVDEAALKRDEAQRRLAEAATRAAAEETQRRTSERLLQEQLAAQNERLLQQGEHVKGLLGDIDERLADLEQRRSQSLVELQQLAIELAIAVSMHVTQGVVDLGQFPIELLVKSAIERLEANRSVVIRLHPVDLVQMQSIVQRTAESWSLPENVKLVADNSLSPGSCLADGGDFGLLSTWEMQLADVHKCLKEGLQDAQTERRTTAAADREMRRFPDRRETA